VNPYLEIVDSFNLRVQRFPALLAMTDGRVRRCCLGLVDQHPDPGALPHIVTRLHDPVPRVRWHAVHVRRSGMNYPLSVVRVFAMAWERAVHFYKRTLEMKSVFIGDGWAEFDTGQAHLALERVDPDDPGCLRPGGDGAVSEGMDGVSRPQK
jgi:hypothetical protein